MTIFLTLGDGDFSYSLDLARFLSLVDTADTNTLIVTGVDSLLDMQEKYKDCSYILRQLQNFNSEENLQKKLAVQIRHEVNAVASSSSSASIAANIVIFNHPHLGTEDAARHSRFLSHFLNQCNTSWLKPSVGTSTGTVHLTLAAGQWERWQGGKAAFKHGYVLAHRVPFQSPFVEESRYQHRRHQTGKSFHTRTAGSETFVLARNKDDKTFLFPWQMGKAALKDTEQPLFDCSCCERTFKEERSLKSHMKALHGEGSNKKRKREIKCPHCGLQGVHKVFSQEQALTDHIQAKHSGPHTTIRPAWAEKMGCQEDATTDYAHGSCEVCDHAFRAAGDALKHVKEFLPTEASLLCDSSFSCQFCSKVFSGQRAQLQHENFCRKGQTKDLKELSK
jgi:DNA-directed RNA polymerase subunit RPC12/RpoP